MAARLWRSPRISLECAPQGKRRTSDLAQDALKVLVVGGTGRVGRMLRRHWQGAPPRGLSLLWQGREDADIMWDAEDGAAALAAHGPVDRLLVLAGVTPGPGVDLDRNVDIARACGAAADGMGAGHVLFASSAAVYGTAKAQPYGEADAPAPATPYGKAKLEAEQAIARAAEDTGVCALRIGNVLGADALMRSAAEASDARPVHLDQFTDGHGPLRSYIGPATLAQVLETLLHKGGSLPEVLNVAAPAPVAMQTLLEAGDIPYVTRPAPPDAVQHVTLDCRALAALHTFHEDASNAGNMLTEWRRLRDAR